MGNDVVFGIVLTVVFVFASVNSSFSPFSSFSIIPMMTWPRLKLSNVIVIPLLNAKVEFTFDKPQITVICNGYTIEHVDN
jgi:hypothetical protein